MLRDTFGLAIGIAFPAFLILLVARELGVLPGLGFLPYLPPVLAVLAIPAIRRTGLPQVSRLPKPALLVGAAFVVAVSVRLGLSLAYETPLGYDAGLYRYVFNAYSFGLPDIPESSLAEWVRTVYPQGLPTFVTALAVFTGLSADALVRYGLPLLSAALVVPIYWIGREAFSQRAGVIAAVLYAISYTHLFTFGLLYLKNAVGLLLLLLALHALQKRQHALFGVFVGGIGIYHRPTLLIVVAVALVFALATRQPRVLSSLALGAIIAAPMLILRWDANWGLLADALGGNAGAATAANDGGGTFFDLGTYRWASLAYQPFALIAVVWCLVRRDWNLPLLLMAVAGGIVALQLFFFRRQIIPLDLAMLLKAGKGIDLAIAWLPEGRRMAMVGALGALLVVGTGAASVRYLDEASPLMDRDQLAVVEWISDGVPADAIIVASAYDAPWVAGWSGREVIAPGQFDIVIHDREEWLDFLESDSADAASEFLSQYPAPLYIYYSGRTASYLDVSKFTGPKFSLVHEEAGARVYAFASSSDLRD